MVQSKIVPSLYNETIKNVDWDKFTICDCTLREGEQAANVLATVRRDQLGDAWTAEEEEEFKRPIREQYERSSAVSELVTYDAGSFLDILCIKFSIANARYRFPGFDLRLPFLLDLKLFLLSFFLCLSDTASDHQEQYQQ